VTAYGAAVAVCVILDFDRAGLSVELAGGILVGPAEERADIVVEHALFGDRVGGGEGERDGGTHLGREVEDVKGCCIYSAFFHLECS